MIVKDRNEEKAFIEKLIKAISSIDTSNLSNVDLLENIILTFIHSMKRI